ncbi:MAG: hypothetical protein WBQ68_14290 [Terriglobales bacterium]
MKHLIVVLLAILLLTVNGLGERLKPGEQARASVAAHRKEAKNHRQSSRYKKGRHRHHRHHGAA